jgi:hypothetical protein
LFELEGIHGNRYDAALRTSPGNNAARDIHLGHEPAAEYITGGIGVCRHGHHLYGEVIFVWQVNHCRSALQARRNNL